MRVPGFPQWIEVKITKDSARSTVHVDIHIAPPFKGIGPKSFPRMSFHPGQLKQQAEVIWSAIVDIETVTITIVAHPPTQMFDLKVVASGVKGFEYQGSLSYGHGPFGDGPNPWDKVVLTHGMLREFMTKNDESKRAAGARHVTTDPKKTKTSLGNVHMMGGQNSVDTMQGASKTLAAEVPPGQARSPVLLGFGIQFDIGLGFISQDLGAGIFTFDDQDGAHLGMFASDEGQIWGFDFGASAGLFDLAVFPTTGPEGPRTAIENFQGQGFAVGGSYSFGVDLGFAILKNSDRTICGFAMECGFGVGFPAQFFVNSTNTVATYT